MQISKDWLKNQLPQTIINRDISLVLDSELQKDEVTIIYGPRQVGKSTVILITLKKWLETNPDLEIFYYNLDYLTSDFENPEKFLKILQAGRNSGKKAVLFLDEAQRLPKLGLFIKYLYDQKPDLKIILSGSISLDIREKIKEPLTGRKNEYFLPPLSISEIFKFHQLDPIKLGTATALTMEILEEALIFGNYPGLLLVPHDQKVQKIRELAMSYLYKDMADLFDLRDEYAVKVVAMYLAENIGNLLNVENLAKMAKLTRYQVEKIIDALEKMYVVKLVKPYYKAKYKELVHASKVYFYDLGIRNALLGKLDKTLIIADKGKLFENLIFGQLISKFNLNDIYFWRTRSGSEIDFIVQNQAKLHLYECKYLQQKRIPEAMVDFEKNNPSEIAQKRILHSENYWMI